MGERGVAFGALVLWPTSSLGRLLRAAAAVDPALSRPCDSTVLDYVCECNKYVSVTTELQEWASRLRVGRVGFGEWVGWVKGGCDAAAL